MLAHTLAVVDKTSPDRLLRLAALFHDVGKPRTRAITDGGVSFHHHEVVGARMTRTRMEALRYSADDVDTVVRLVELHLRFHTYRLGWTDKAVRRYVRDAGDQLERLNELTRCDCTTRNASKAPALARRMDELEARIAELGEEEELRRLRPDLTGNQVMELLGVSPGPVVGQALAFLMELRLDEGPLGEEEAGRRLIDGGRRAGRRSPSRRRPPEQRPWRSGCTAQHGPSRTSTRRTRLPDCPWDVYCTGDRDGRNHGLGAAPARNGGGHGRHVRGRLRPLAAAGARTRSRPLHHRHDQRLQGVPRHQGP